jgi:hypothetical protein
LALQDAGSAIVRTALLGLAAPVGAAALVLAVSARPWRGRAGESRAFGPPLALGLAFLAAFVATHGWPRIGGAATLRDKLVCLGLVVALVQARPVRRSSVLVGFQALTATVMPWFLLEFQRERHWDRAEGVLWSAGLGLFVFLAWILAGEHESRRSSPAPVWGWALATLLAAGTYQVSGSSQVAQLGGGLALALGCCALLALWRRSAGLGLAGVGPFVVLYVGLTWCGRFISELSLVGFVLLSLAPLGVLAARFVPPARPRLAAALEVLVPTGLALAALLFERAQAAPAPYGY